MPSGEVYRDGDVSYTDHGFGLVRNSSSGSGTTTTWSRYYQWNEENRLKRSVEGDLTVDYRYGADGERAVKYSKRSETLYFDSMWQAMTDYPSLRQSKHVYVGKVRVATRLSISGAVDVGYEETNTYYYHPDHVGSAQLVTDADGAEYERIEYTPYGELWVEKTSDGFAKIPFRFTGKELDDETGLYYYGARYLDPRTSTWLSADPALGDYIPVAPVDDEAKKKNGNLPGMGGVYNLVNLHLYHYAGNNPVKYTDPDGNMDAGISNQDGSLSDKIKGEVNGRKVLSEARVFVAAKFDYKFGAKVDNKGSYSIDDKDRRVKEDRKIDCSGLTQRSTLLGAGVDIGDGSDLQTKNLKEVNNAQVGGVVRMEGKSHTGIVASVNTDGNVKSVVESCEKYGAREVDVSNSPSWTNAEKKYYAVPIGQ